MYANDSIWNHWQAFAPFNFITWFYVQTGNWTKNHENEHQQRNACEGWEEWRRTTWPFPQYCSKIDGQLRRQEHNALKQGCRVCIKKNTSMPIQTRPKISKHSPNLNHFPLLNTTHSFKLHEAAVKHSLIKWSHIITYIIIIIAMRPIHWFTDNALQSNPIQQENSGPGIIVIKNTLESSS